MKKVISIICVFTMLTFSLISCGKQSTDVNPSNTLDNNNVVEVTNTNENDSINYTISKEEDYVACLPEDLFEIADVVVKGTFGKTINTYVCDNSLPVTQIVFNVDDVHKGKIAGAKIIVEYYGGTVSMYSYLDTLTEEQIAKRGLDCSVSEAAKMTVSYGMTKESVSVNEKDSYMLFLSYDKENDTYFILCDAYGACKMDKGLIYSLAEEKYVDAEFK